MWWRRAALILNGMGIQGHRTGRPPTPAIPARQPPDPCNKLAWAERHDLGTGAAHDPQSPNGGPAGQGRTRRAGLAIAGRAGARCLRCRHQDPGSGGAGPDRSGIRHLSPAPHRRSGRPHAPRARACAAAARPRWPDMLAASHHPGGHDDAQEPGLCRPLCLWPHANGSEAARGGQDKAQVPLARGMEDRREGQVSCIHRLEDLRAHSDHVARQPGRVSAQQDPRHPARRRRVAPRHRLVRRMWAQDDRALQGRQPIHVQQSAPAGRRSGRPARPGFRSAATDASVAAAFLAAVAPAEIDAWARARKAQRHADETLQRAEMQQIERLRYEAGLAERQFNRVDPDNRLVAAELERRWETALCALRRAEEALARRASQIETQSDRLDPRLRAKVVSLGQRLPELWADPSVSREHRKALLRCLIDKVVLRRAGRDSAQVRIVWRGGETTELKVLLPVNAVAALPRYGEMEQQVLALARAGFDDVEIARQLTAEGHRSPRCATVFPSTVQRIRLQHRLKLPPKQTRWAKIPGRLSVPEVAAHLGVTTNWVSSRIYRGVIRVERDTISGRHLFADTPATLMALRQLQAGTVKRLDFTKNHYEQEGHQDA